MFASIADRTKSSLRLRLLVATLVLLALALAVAAVAFERVARSVIVDAVHSHLSARAEEVQAAVVRFQRERSLAVRNWAEAEAMQMTVDSGDPKFAEDYLRRTIQDQGGTIAAAALLDMDGAVIAAVREGAAGERRGVPVVSLRGVVIGDSAVKAALEGGAELSDGVAAGTAPLSRLDPTEGGALGVMVAAPVKDFAADFVGVVVAVISPQGLSRLLGGIAGEDGRFQPIVADEAARARRVRARRRCSPRAGARGGGDGRAGRARDLDPRRRRPGALGPHGAPRRRAGLAHAHGGPRERRATVGSTGCARSSASCSCSSSPSRGSRASARCARRRGRSPTSRSR